MDREIKKYNSTTGQWESVYSGGITDGTLLITPDKIGDLSTLQTTVKTNLVSAVNENTAKLSSANATTVTLSRGQNLVTTNPNGASTVPFNVLSIKGRTLINLLGRDGNCEDVSKWTGYQSTLSLDTSNKVYGSNSIKVTGSATNNVQFQHNAPSTIINSNTSYYIILAEVKNGNWAGNFDLSFSDANSSTFVPNASSFTTVYQKLTGDILSGKNISIRAFNGAIGQYFYVDGFRVYQISQSEYNALGTTLTDINKIAEKYPYVDDMKSLQNPYANVYGQNLLPDFSQWVLSPATSSDSVTLLESYKVQLSVTTTSVETKMYGDVTLMGGQTYTFNNPSTNGYVRLAFKDSSGTVLSRSVINPATSLTFTTTSTTVLATINFTNSSANDGLTGITSGTFVFDKPMLNLGSTALPFVTRNDSPVYFQTVLASDPLQTIQDTLAPINGGFVKTSRIKVMDLDGSLSWGFGADYTGFKTVNIDGLALPVQDTERVVKYDGKIISHMNWGGTFAQSDYSTIGTFNSAGRLGLSISDTDTGWGETYTPTAQEIQAYFNGWKMGDSTNSSLYTTGTKYWWNIVTGAAPATQSDINYVVNNKNPSALYTNYRLLYQLAQPTQETIVTDGLYPVLQAGANQVELGEAVIVREPSTPYYDNIANTYYINAATIKAPAKYLVGKILTVYKNGKPDPKWSIAQGGANNFWYAQCPASNYDPTASYSFTYIAQPYAVSSSILSLDGSYESNLRKDVDKNTQNIADLGERLTAVELTKANRNQGQWLAPTLLNGWVNADATNDTVQYYKNEFGEVSLRGQIKSGSTGFNTPIFYLPSGYRPSHNMAFPCRSSNGSTEVLATILVNSNGAIGYLSGSTVGIDLDSIKFRAEQ
jgi:hypothetical protein